jgi:hypothetical protein
MAHAQRGGGKKSGGCKLRCPGWNEQTRLALERLIDQGAGKHLPVVFDFDNTLVCGDLQEATLAVLARDGMLTAEQIPETLSPPFRVPGRKRVAIQSAADITEYYEAFLAATAHGDRDPSPLATGYAWAIEALVNLRVSEIVAATRTVCESLHPPHPGFIQVAPGRTKFAVPFFYPEMVELVAALIGRRFDIWVVSATNVWGVRWMVQHELNLQLRRHGVRTGLRADHIIGVSTLLTDRRDHLYKDALLVHENFHYAVLDESVCRQFRLTSRLQYPVPTYSGKVACILDAIGRPPYLCIGDSPGDHAMMSFSQNRLWIARLDKTGFQHKTARLLNETGHAGWLLQATLTKGRPGFVAEHEDAWASVAGVPRAARAAAGAVAALSKRMRPH